jgi:hypothetical protein
MNKRLPKSDRVVRLAASDAKWASYRRNLEDKLASQEASKKPKKSKGR